MVVTGFSRTLRSVHRDGDRRRLFVLGAAALALAVWLAWLFLGRLTVVERSLAARLVVDRAVHPLEAALPGEVARSHLELGREVRAGDPLVELDATAARLALEAERVQIAGLRGELEALDEQVRAQEAALGEGRASRAAAAAEGEARSTELRLATELAEAERASYEELAESGGASGLQITQARVEAERAAAALEAWPATVARTEHESLEREADRRAAIAALRRAESQLDARIAAGEQALDTLAFEVERRVLRAPATGVIAETAPLGRGSHVAEGERLAAIVAAGELAVSADFEPAAILGRVRPGQAARVRLDGFPWSRFGTLPAVVRSVASEARDGRIRVELALREAPSDLPLQHGLPGSVEIEIERVSPAELVLRAAGKGARENAGTAPR